MGRLILRYYLSRHKSIPLRPASGLAKSGTDKVIKSALEARWCCGGGDPQRGVYEIRDLGAQDIWPGQNQWMFVLVFSGYDNSLSLTNGHILQPSQWKFAPNWAISNSQTSRFDILSGHQFSDSIHSLVIGPWGGDPFIRMSTTLLVYRCHWLRFIPANKQVWSH